MRCTIKKTVHLLVAILMIVGKLGVTSPAFAATATELEEQLSLQVEINKLLKARIRQLEAEVSAYRTDASNSSVIQPRLGPPPEDLASLDESDSALDETLIQRGSAVLRPWQVQITPGLSWSHSGSGAATLNNVTAGIAGRFGLPGDWMVGLALPYVAHASNSMGHNHGFGNWTAGVWKQFVSSGAHHPSVVGSLFYSAPIEENKFNTPVPTGSAFHAVTANLSVTQRIDPIAFFGDVYYSHSFEREFANLNRQPGDIFGVGVGASLAVTPRISLQTGIDVAFARREREQGFALPGTERTAGAVNLGVGFILGKGTYLSLSGQFGVTDDAPDLVLGASLPIRF